MLAHAIERVARLLLLWTLQLMRSLLLGVLGSLILGILRCLS